MGSPGPSGKETHPPLDFVTIWGRVSATSVQSFGLRPGSVDKVNKNEDFSLDP